MALAVEAWRAALSLVNWGNPKITMIQFKAAQAAIMRQAGVDEVFSGEGEVALAMTEYILSILGATPEQMDREHQRVRHEVLRISKS